MRLRHTPLIPNVAATLLTLGAWSIGWTLLARRNGKSNRKRCCAYCGEYLLAYTAEERASARARRECEMAGELSGPKPTIAAPPTETPQRPAPALRSRRLPSQRV